MYKLDTTEAIKTIGLFADRGREVTRGIYRGINKVAATTFTQSKREIRSRVTLESEYIDSRMGLRKASSAKLEATIYARKRPTRLATYGAKQLTRASRKKSKQAKGDALRGISPGRVQSGVSVKVLRKGGRKQMKGAFFVPLKRGKADLGGNGMGVFIRTGKGKGDIKHLYSLSVDQVFRSVRDEIEPQVKRDLQETIGKQILFELGKGRKK